MALDFAMAELLLLLLLHYCSFISRHVQLLALVNHGLTSKGLTVPTSNHDRDVRTTTQLPVDSTGSQSRDRN